MSYSPWGRKELDTAEWLTHIGHRGGYFINMYVYL